MRCWFEERWRTTGAFSREDAQVLYAKWPDCGLTLGGYVGVLTAKLAREIPDIHEITQILLK